MGEVQVQTNVIVLLSCVKSKRSYRCKAGDMYTSPLFQKMMAYAYRMIYAAIFGSRSARR